VLFFLKDSISSSIATFHWSASSHAKVSAKVIGSFRNLVMLAYLTVATKSFSLLGNFLSFLILWGVFGNFESWMVSSSLITLDYRFLLIYWFPIVWLLSLVLFPTKIMGVNGLLTTKMSLLMYSFLWAEIHTLYDFLL